MLKLNISSKILFSFLIVSLVPLLLVIFILVNSARSQLRDAAIVRQQLAASKTADSVDNYIASKVNVLIFQSQTSGVRNLKNDEISQNLSTFMKQDRDLVRVALLDKYGMEKVALNTQGPIKELVNQATSNAYKATTFLSGKEYVGPVSYNDKGEPMITMAVPLISYESQQNLNNLSTGELAKFRTIDEIQGVLVADYNIKDLWKTVLSTRIGQGGYAYVVDDRGNLVAHPDSSIFTKKQNLKDVYAVEEVINGQEDTQESISETGSKVISTPKKLTRSNWAVIVEEPVESVFSGINSYLKRSVLVFVVAVTLAISISLFFKSRIVGPIKKLSYGANRMGKGDFSHKISINSRDELQELADAFNNMGLSIQQLVNGIRAKNISLVIEQAKLNSIIRSVSDGVMALNKEGEIISINPPAAKLVGKTTDDLQGKLLTDVFPWVHEGKQFIPDIQKVGNYKFTDLILPHGDEISYLDLVVSVIERKESDIVAIITIHDLTPGRELDVMKLDFVAIAAHELRTPLTVVRGYLNLINADAVKQLTIYNIENLQRAMIGTDQLSNLINNLLNVSRIERGEMDIAISKLDLARLVVEVIKQNQVTAILKEQSIEYNGPKKNVFVPADVSTISEVLNNLIGNALKFTANGGKVSVNLLSNNNEVRVEIVDDGPGIPPVLRSRLFTKFYRVERSLVSGNRGTGLGLYISKTIIDLHHGKIGLESGNEKGSIFYFTLPVYDNEKHAKLISRRKESVGVHGWVKKHTNR